METRVTTIEIKDIARPPRALCDALAAIGTATLSSELAQHLGIRDPQIRGPRPLKKGRTIAGPALTLQCMPKREDLYGAAEYGNPELQLHRHVMYPTQAGDVIVVDARGDLGSGIFGEMMLTFFAGAAAWASWSTVASVIRPQPPSSTSASGSATSPRTTMPRPTSSPLR